MSKFSITVVVVVCLVGVLAEAGGNWLNSKTKTTKKPKYTFRVGSKLDFKALDGYFEERPNVLNDKLLGSLEQDTNKFEGNAKKAAELLVKIWKFDTTQCNSDALELLKQIREAGLTTVQQEPTNLVINGYLTKLMETCEYHILETVEQQRQACQSGSRLAKLMEVLNPGYINEHQVAKGVGGEVSVSTRPVGILKPTQTADILRYLVKSEANFDANGKIIDTDDGQQKERLFEEHLVNPCKKFISEFSHLFDGMKDILQIQVHSTKHGSLNPLAFTDLACRTITSMGKMDKATFYEAL